MTRLLGFSVCALTLVATQAFSQMTPGNPTGPRASPQSNVIPPNNINCKDWSYNPAMGGMWKSAEGTKITVGSCKNMGFSGDMIAAHVIKLCGKYDLTDILDAKCGITH